MRVRLTIWILAMMVFVIPIAAFGLYVLYERKFAHLPVYGMVENVNGKEKYHTIPDFELTNQDEKKISTDHWKDKIVVANFFFSHCPVICPKMTNNLRLVQDAFSEESGKLLINSISIDPERDDPGRLRIYARKFAINTNNWQLLTGAKPEIYKLARNGFMIVATDGDGGPEDFIHSEKLVLVDLQRRIRGYYDGTNRTEVNKLIHDIKKLQNEN